MRLMSSHRLFGGVRRGKMGRLCEFFILIATLNLQTAAAMDVDTWPSESTKWPAQAPHSQILYQNEIAEPAGTTLEEIIEKSDDFPIEFPTNSTRCFHLLDTIDKKILEDNVNSAYPLIHEQALHLFVSFLSQKRRFGSKSERDLYQNMTLLGLIDRLLTKRAVVFVGPQDEYLLIDGTKGEGNWEKIGTGDEAPPLTLENSLSYDEIKLSALLAVSSPSYSTTGGHGVVIGAVGARLEKEKVMEYREVMKTKEQNTHMYGYGQFFVPTMQGVFSNFYGDVSLTYQELEMRKVFEDKDRYIQICDDKYFDKRAYARRIALAIDILLIEANDRAQQQNESALLHVVGLGLGEWRITPEQDKSSRKLSKSESSEFLGPSLGSLSKVYFSPLENYSINEKIVIEDHPQGGIKVTDKQTKNWENSENLPIFSYNWNGNALPGNEYWLHKLTASDGAVMATSSQIAELHNPHINANLGASNLRVVTLNGLFTFKDYLEIHKND